MNTVDKEIVRFIVERLSGKSGIALVGSRYYGYHDDSSDYDFIAVNSSQDQNIIVDDLVILGVEVQVINYHHSGWVNLLNYFRTGHSIDGDWGELGLEAYLHFIAESRPVAGPPGPLRELKSLLEYPEFFRERVLQLQLPRLVNSIRQSRHSANRSPALDLKSRYDFLDSFLRLLYARNGRFYSTIKWYEKDLARFEVPDSVVCLAKQILNSRTADWADSAETMMHYLHKSSS